MKSEAKDYVELSINQNEELKKYGFLVVNTYEENQQKPVFKSSNVFLVEFNSNHSLIEKINFQEIVGDGNASKIKNFVNTQKGENEFTTHQIFWHANTFLTELKKYKKWNNSKLPIPHLKKEVSNRAELKTFCKKANNLIFEECKIANQRALTI